MQSARNAALMTFPLLTIACLVLIYALLNHEYSISYVWKTTDNATPTFYCTRRYGAARPGRCCSGRG